MSAARRAKQRLEVARLPLLGLAVVSLWAGVWIGLARIGWSPARAAGSLSALHGPLMVSGFFGALIGLERAVAHGARAAFVAPLAAGASALLALVGLARASELAALSASGLFVVVSALLAKRSVQDFTLVLVLAAACWLGGNVALAVRGTGDAPVPAWIAFLVLTVFAERRELGRVLGPGPVAAWTFGGASLALAVGAALATLFPEAPAWPFGLGLLSAGLWLAAFDVARVTVRRAGLTRFMAVNLLAAQAWLGVAAVLWTFTDGARAGASWDARLHAIFVGFVLSMVFGHAPIIFPAILGVGVGYRPAFYLHVALLNVSLVARIVGDLSGVGLLRTWGGVGNALALVLFFGSTLSSVLAAKRRVA